MQNSINISSFLLKINNGREIILNGSPVSGEANTFRFPISEDIGIQLLNCNNFTLQVIGQGIHAAHREPWFNSEGSLGVVAVKRFINYWMNGETPVNMASAATETQSSSQTNEQGAGNRSLPRYDNNRKLPFPNHPPNCCHNILGRR